MEIIAIVLLVFVLFALIAWAGISRMVKGSAVECDPKIYEQLKWLNQYHQNTREIQNAFAHKLDALQEQADHLARVQLLILKELKKEHQVQPQKDVLVTIEPLPEFKNKERGR